MTQGTRGERSVSKKQQGHIPRYHFLVRTWKRLEEGTSRLPTEKGREVVTKCLHTSRHSHQNLSMSHYSMNACLSEVLYVLRVEHVSVHVGPPLGFTLD